MSDKLPEKTIHNQRYKISRKQLEDRIDKYGYVFSRKTNKKQTIGDLLYEIKNSNFSKVSLFTGRCWNIYKNELIKIIKHNLPSNLPNWGGITPQIS